MLRILIIFTALVATISSCTIGVHLQINPDNSGTYALEVIYKDSVKSLMGNLMDNENKDELHAAVFDNAAMSKIPGSITMHDLKETDSSAILTFDFPSIEDLNALFDAMQEDSKMTQHLEFKGTKKYNFIISTEAHQDEKKDDPTSAMGMFDEILFGIHLDFPGRKIQNVKKIASYKITDNAQRLIYEMPLTELSKIEQPIAIQLKVKKQD